MERFVSNSKRRLVIIAVMALLPITAHAKADAVTQPEAVAKRYCFVSDIQDNPKSIGAYTELWKAGFPRKLADEFNAAGVNELEIYLFRNRLFAIMETRLDFQLNTFSERLETLPVYQAWNEREGKYLLPLPGTPEGQKWQLVDRVYELEEVKWYRSEEGYVQRAYAVPSRRFVDARQLVNDPEQIDAYKAHHAMGKAWPEITRGLKEVGVIDLEIYMVGNRTYKIHEVTLDFDPNVAWKELGAKPRSKEWGKLVGSSDRPFTDDNGNRIKQVMDRIFKLSNAMEMDKP